MKILLGSGQVLALLPGVLELVFPENPKQILSFVGLLVADVKSVLRPECWGWSWYERWLTEVLALPIASILLVLMVNIGRQMSICGGSDLLRRCQQMNRVLSATIRQLAFVAMVLYPQISTAIFSAFQCRQLGEQSSCLEADYSISCNDERYRKYKFTAFCLTIIVPLGFPIGLLASFWYQWNKSCTLWMDQLQERSESDSLASFHHSRMQRSFSFYIKIYRLECWWFEPVDMLRKLALTGLLQFFHRGSAAQCFCGCALAFMSFGLQHLLQPYREKESNALKAIVDMQLFLTFLISFILRVLPKMNTSEPFDEDAYGWLLLMSFVTLLCLAIGLTVALILRRHRFLSRLSIDGEHLMAVSSPRVSTHL